MKRTSGFTLLEVLAALVLLALLLVGVYSGIRTASHSVSSGTAALQRIDQIRAAQDFLRRELMQSRTVPIGKTDNDESIYFVGSERQMRYVAPLPGYLGKLGAQLQQLQLVDDGHGELELVVRLALLPPDGKPPKPLGEPQVLLDHIKSGSFHYRGVDGQGQAVDWADTWTDGRVLPQLVRIKLKVLGNYDWPEMDIPLEVNPMIRSVMIGVPRSGFGARNTP